MANVLSSKLEYVVYPMHEVLRLFPFLGSDGGKLLQLYLEVALSFDFSHSSDKVFGWDIEKASSNLLYLGELAIVQIIDYKG